MVDIKGNYKFDLGVKGLNSVIKIMAEKAGLLKIGQNHFDFTNQPIYNLKCLHLCFDQSLKIAMGGTKEESLPIWYKKMNFQIMTLINLCHMICNQVNEEKFMFQIGTIKFLL